MKIRLKLQAPRPAYDDSIDAALVALVSEREWTKISVAVAYASVAGVTRLCNIIREKRPNITFRWVLGLDDYITQPGAIEFCESLPKSSTRVFSSAGANHRFHPKVFVFEDDATDKNVSIVVGSANLTYAALSKNCEAIAILENSGQLGVKSLEELQAVWNLGKTPTADIISDYKAKFARFRPTRKFVLETEPRISKNKDVLSFDGALISPSKANTCWIEVGKNTAQGRELEFKAEQALFFGLDPVSKTAKIREFKVSNGKLVKLRLKHQTRNSMWRLQLRNEVPEVVIGLRPKTAKGLGRSPYVAVFKRLSGNEQFGLKFIRRDSKNFAKLLEKSLESGTVGTTAAREYGWL